MSKTVAGNFFEDFHVGQKLNHPTPRTLTRPIVGLSWPFAMRRSVDLPAPFAPTRPVIPPVSSSVT